MAWTTVKKKCWMPKEKNMSRYIVQMWIKVKTNMTQLVMHPISRLMPSYVKNATPKQWLAWMAVWPALTVVIQNVDDWQTADRINNGVVWPIRRLDTKRFLSADGRSSVIAPRQLLLHCSTTVHPWTYALLSVSVPDSTLPIPSLQSYYSQSLDIYATMRPRH